MNKDYITKQQMLEYSAYISEQLKNIKEDDDESTLDKIPFEKIERYVRKKKLDRIQKKNK